MVVTEADAQKAQTPRDLLANEYLNDIRHAVIDYRRDHSLKSILIGFAYTVLASGALILLLWALSKLGRKLRDRLEHWIGGRSHVEHATAVHALLTYLGKVFLAAETLPRAVVVILLIKTYLTLVLGFFPYTRAISIAVSYWVFSMLGALLKSALQYLPNLLIVAVIVFVATLAIRLISLVFNELAKGTLKISGFYPDWAAPTSKLIRALVIVLVIIVVFPYLPGSKSPAFQGISIFVGVLLSLGSTSAVANGIAGVILTYMRSFLVGDWVKIGDTTGLVVEKSILVTRILTPKNEVITIPNSTVMSGAVMDYSLEVKKSGVIFHTIITIGYEAPWRKVHELLIEAALATKYVLHEPPPFVLQSALSDFYVAYELNAYTDSPVQMQFIYSELHQNIQDKFNEAAVEICSPHFSALRDGNAIAIPRRYVPDDYTPRGFRLEETEREEAKAAAKNS